MLDNFTEILWELVLGANFLDVLLKNFDISSPILNNFSQILASLRISDCPLFFLEDKIIFLVYKYAGIHPENIGQLERILILGRLVEIS